MGDLEAREWINQNDGKICGISEDSETKIVGEDFRTLVTELYDSGAVKVTALRLTDCGDAEDGSGLETALPANPFMRKALFDIPNRVRERWAVELTPKSFMTRMR